jgi:predicted oxidoreductase
MQASNEIMLMLGRKALQNISSQKREKYIFWKKCGIRQEENIDEASRRSSVGSKVIDRVDHLKSEHGTLSVDNLQVHCIWWGRKFSSMLGQRGVHYCDSVI